MKDKITYNEYQKAKMSGSVTGAQISGKPGDWNILRTQSSKIKGNYKIVDQGVPQHSISNIKNSEAWDSKDQDGSETYTIYSQIGRAGIKYAVLD